MKPHLFAAVVAVSLLTMGADKMPPYQQWRKLIEAAPADTRGPDKGRWTEVHRKALEDWLIKTHVKQTVRLDARAAAIATDPVPMVEAAPPPVTLYGCRFNGYVSYTFKPESRDAVAKLKKGDRIEAEGTAAGISLKLVDGKKQIYSLTFQLKDCTISAEPK